MKFACKLDIRKVLSFDMEVNNNRNGWVANKTQMNRNKLKMTLY